METNFGKTYVTVYTQYNYGECSNSTRYKTHASAIQNVIECISAYDQAIKYKYNNKYTTFFTPTV